MPNAIAKQSLAEIAQIRPIKIEDFPAVRHLHTAAFKHACCARLSESEIAAFTHYVNTVEYMDDLLRQDLAGAFVYDELVGTAGWCPADDRGITARLRSVFVRPLFEREKIGEKLVRHAEARALRAGFQEFTLQAGHHTEPFFTSLGYEMSSQGTQVLPDGAGLPVIFMKRVVANDCKDTERR